MDTRTRNPLLEPWTAPHGLPPFGAIAPEHFEPAIDAAMAAHLAELDAIAGESAAPDFDNSVAALDRSGRLLRRLLSVFYSLASSATTPVLQAVQRRIAAPLAAHDSAVHCDARLFARLDALHAKRDALGLDEEQRRLLERLHLDFVRSGAKLAPDPQRRHAAVVQDLAPLTTQFGQNVLHDEENGALLLTSEADLAGVPSPVRAAARAAAISRGEDGWSIGLVRSIVVPFLTFAERRDLRERAWRAWVGRGEIAGEHDNRPIARRILELRAEQARLHGFACYADFALADTMAGTPAAVRGLLDEVWPRAQAALERERAELRQVMDDAGVDADTAIEPWDWRYWAEKVRRTHYAVDDAEVKPYFPLPAIVEAAFDCAGRLFGVTFTPRPDLPVYHPDVVAYEVRDRDGNEVGVFMQDNFARAGKRSGAWMSSLRLRRRNGGDERPIIQNNNNFARGAEGEPALLSQDDARTLFHEFGHGLHGMLSDVRYLRLSGTQVLRDFVELPSQLFEHWITEPEVLRRHARHWQTGEPIPDALIQRLEAAARFGQGYETVRYTASALVDLAAHSRSEPPADVCAFEGEVLAAVGQPPGVGINHRLVHFQHLFAGSSYASQYYVYLWAEVLDADAYGAFVEAGSPFDPATAERLRRCIYASGNTVEPGAAFAAFRGRPPRVEPLLVKRGLAEAATA